MGLSSTLNGSRVTHAHVTIPAWGVWDAEVTVDGEIALEGSVTLRLADLTLVGTVLSGGAMIGRSSFRIVGGAGGWRQVVPSKAYVNDAGVKVTKVLGDVAATVGETVEISTDDRVGPAWTREAGAAGATLNLVAPRGWYVGEDGVTRLGSRAAGKLAERTTRVQTVNLARGKVVLAAESIASILPGLVVDGITAVDVLHELSPEGGLRSTVWGSQAASALDAMSALILQLDPERSYRGLTEYRVVLRQGNLLDLQPVRVSSGMPDLPRVAAWPGVPGARVVPSLASRCLVGFIDSDPARPVVVGFESNGSTGAGLDLTTDGFGAGGHAITLEQVIGLFAQYTAARFLVSDLGTTFGAAYTAAPPAALLTLIGPMIAGATLPATPVGATPGSVLDSLGLPALIAAALAVQLPDPASIGLPSPVIPGLGKKAFLL